jgi:hypothetical protein
MNAHRTVKKQQGLWQTASYALKSCGLNKEGACIGRGMRPQGETLKQKPLHGAGVLLTFFKEFMAG